MTFLRWCSAVWWPAGARCPCLPLARSCPFFLCVGVRVRVRVRGCVGVWVCGRSIPCSRRFLDSIQEFCERGRAAVFRQDCSNRLMLLSHIQELFAQAASNSGLMFGFSSRSLTWRANESTSDLDVETRTER